MRAKRVREVREILRSEAFSAWFKRYNELRQDLNNGQERYEDLLAQASMVAYNNEVIQQKADEAVFNAGECEDLSVGAHAEFAEIENNSFELLSAFEAQRNAAGEALAALHRAEKTLEDDRARASEIRAELEAGEKRHEATLDGKRQELEELDRRAERLGADVEHHKANLARQLDRREELWQEVETTWSHAFRANMARAEYTYQARRVREEAEKLFARAAKERERYEALQKEAERMEQKLEAVDEAFVALLEEGRETFECTLIEEFLFWPRENDVHAAICVPLIDERNHLNIQVVALQIYHVERARGLDFIEPMAELEAEEDDPRLDEFFLRGRPAA